MLLIECPWCGPREELEFRYGGEAGLVMPERAAELSDAEWAEYLFMRRNPKGTHRERWVHASGCRRWFTLTRHTVTHEILEVSRPELDGPGEAPGGEDPRPGDAPVKVKRRARS